jgi:Sec-independent protein translocase protein TatA
MPELNLRERLPELRLPEMSRDDIAKALGEARKELGEVRKDLNEFRRELEVPRMDLSRVDPSKLEMPNVDVGKEIRDAGKDLRDAGKHMAKNARSAAQDAGLVKRPSRLPFVIAGAVTLGLVGWALANSPSIKARLRQAVQQIQDRMAERRAAWDEDEAEPRAFDAAAVAVPIQPSAYADSTTDKDSPFSEPPSDLPEGFGKTNGKRTGASMSDEPARA